MIRIVTDSTSDLSRERREELNIESLPLSVHFGEETFRDGVDITNREFYERLAQVETLPTTAQVNPEEFAALFRKYLDQGDEVVGIFISGAMSGTCQSAAIARDMVDGEAHIFIVDSHTVTFALGLLVETAVLLRDQGLSAREIAARIEELSGRTRLLAVVDTLKYLKMGGRIRAATAVVGGLLGISPIITIENGLVESIGKARGRKAAFQWIERRMESEQPDLSLPVSFGHSNSPEAMAECQAYFADKVAGAAVLGLDIGSVVGTHVGPGATGIVYFVKR